MKRRCGSIFWYGESSFNSFEDETQVSVIISFELVEPFNSFEDETFMTKCVFRVRSYCTFNSFEDETRGLYYSYSPWCGLSIPLRMKQRRTSTLHPCSVTFNSFEDETWSVSAMGSIRLFLSFQFLWGWNLASPILKPLPLNSFNSFEDETQHTLPDGIGYCRLSIPLRMKLAENPMNRVWIDATFNSFEDETGRKNCATLAEICSFQFLWGWNFNWRTCGI